MKLTDFKNFFANTSKIIDLNSQLKIILQEYHITTFSFTYYAYHPHSKNKLKYDFCSPNFSIWHNHYIGENYENIDTTLNEAYHTTLPVFWDLNAQYHSAKCKKEKQMRLDGINFGAEKGLSIPIHGPNDDFATLLLVQMKGENCLDYWTDIQDELYILANCYYQHLQKLLVLNPTSENKYQLTERELQCLLLTAHKKSVVEISAYLSIKERTVNFHLQSANRKLGAQNKYQSVAKALAKGLIIL